MLPEAFRQDSSSPALFPLPPHFPLLSSRSPPPEEPLRCRAAPRSPARPDPPPLIIMRCRPSPTNMSTRALANLNAPANAAANVDSRRHGGKSEPRGVCTRRAEHVWICPRGCNERVNAVRMQWMVATARFAPQHCLFLAEDVVRLETRCPVRGRGGGGAHHHDAHHHESSGS